MNSRRRTLRTSKRTSEVQSTHGVTYVMACEELTDFLGNIEQKIGKESYEIITNTLRDNFTSRLSLKLLDPENVDVIFAKSKLPEKFLTTTGICYAMNRRYQSLNHSEPIPQVKKVQLTQSQR